MTERLITRGDHGLRDGQACKHFFLNRTEHVALKGQLNYLGLLVHKQWLGAGQEWRNSRS